MGALTARSGPRPRTTSVIPHSQVDQQPDDAVHLDAVLGEALTWPGVRGEASGISVPGAQALVLDEASATGPEEAFLVGREFCHGHAQGDFSLHMALPLALALDAERTGWAEPHLYVRTGQVPANLVMVYAPRDDTERGVVADLVRASYDFASPRRRG